MSADVSPLESAERAAASQNASADTNVAPCRRYRIEVVVLDDAERPLPDVKVELRGPRGTLRTKTDRQGTARFEGIPGGAYQYNLSGWSSTTWERVREEPLEDPASEGDAPFATGSSPAPHPESHEIERGEGIVRLADRFGLSPEAVWAANEPLAASRPTMNILVPGDTVRLPTTDARFEPAKTGRRYVVRRLVASSWLRVRFLDSESLPRAEVPYLLSLERLCGSPVADVAGLTDTGGLIERPVPADVTVATITLHAGDEPEVHRVLVHHLEPVTTTRGLQARLRNLGLGCGDEDGTIGEATRRAVAYFQRQMGFEPTGEFDAATQRALVRLHRS